ncbi:class I SAM-dependent methyltransferase [Synechococcus elongatus]|uniref:class I SAM-dependent methyltransferase n=1 Tax=Synechococcus elongatus TaxID=32046 RepID=UPI0030D20D8C
MVDSQPDASFAAVQTTFSQGWQVYDKILQHDYMDHQQVYGILQSHYQSLTAPFDLLELGCGDASQSVLALNGSLIRSYRGVDLSAVALQLAEAHVSQLRVPVLLQVGELLNYLQTCRDRFDQILVAFALHHLSAEQKQTFWQAAAQCLRTGGQLLLADVFRLPNESREQYLDRYQQFVVSQWSAMTATEQDFINAHIRQSDFPETDASMRDWAVAAGFTDLDCLYFGNADTQKIWRCSLPKTAKGLG